MWKSEWHWRSTRQEVSSSTGDLSHINPSFIPSQHTNWMHNIRMVSVAFGLDHKSVSVLGGLLIQKWTIMEFWSSDSALEGYAILMRLTSLWYHLLSEVLLFRVLLSCKRSWLSTSHHLMYDTYLHHSPIILHYKVDSKSTDVIIRFSNTWKFWRLFFLQ